jgi:MoaA/NifB/PqqE/SkfB family radical SAM enzyme
MKKSSIVTIEVDSQGHLILPADICQRYGLIPGAKIRLEQNDTGMIFSRSSENLARVYVEPTNLCNLDCVTCMRNVWDEDSGYMSSEIFNEVLDGIKTVHPVPSIFFGGFGEPLTHPAIVEMVAQSHQAGAVVELITNGILLTQKMARQLKQAGLNRLWVSIDGATPESYSDVRLGAALPQVIENLRYLTKLRGWMSADLPRLGIAFVAMKRNIADLPEILRLGKSLGADQFSISNVLPHTPELRREMLYLKSVRARDLIPSEWSPLISIPRLDNDEAIQNALLHIHKTNHVLSVSRQVLDRGTSSCPFVEKASLSVRWDGAISPCLPLLHTHDSYLDTRQRKSYAHSVGSLQNRTLLDIWNDAAYRSLRETLVQFDYAPCIYCNSCEMADDNQEDCFGNVLPACGGCLWADGYIQCP